jgi:hypothetical protein
MSTSERIARALVAHRYAVFSVLVAVFVISIASGAAYTFSFLTEHVNAALAPSVEPPSITQFDIDGFRQLHWSP